MSMHAGANPERRAKMDSENQCSNEVVPDVVVEPQHGPGQWQPSDLARFVLGLQWSRQGKTVKADVARTWFGPKPQSSN